MSHLQTVIMLGVLAWVVLVWLIVRFFGIAKSTDQELDDMEQVAAVSRPAPLEPRPHVMAGGHTPAAPAPTSTRVQRTPFKP